MPDSSSFVLGFDPGGKSNFGWSLCEVDADYLRPPCETGLANDACDALCKARSALPSNAKVLAAGIDAPLTWGKMGNRQVERVLRQALRNSKFPPEKLGGAIQAVNSLRGACLVQGILLAEYLNEAWEGLTITESHPRALRYLLNRAGQPKNMAKRMTAGLDDHERDATLSAISAWAAICRPMGWRNLYEEAYPRSIMPIGIPVSYWMPKQ